jgi:4'-phosphopantetheinyl transferase
MDCSCDIFILWLRALLILQVGVDIVDINSRSGLAKSFTEFSSMFDSQFHPTELRNMHFESEERLQYLAFYVNWALKETFVKAIGVGIGYGLLHVIVSCSIFANAL